jgi:hydrogenase-4 component F
MLLIYFGLSLLIAIIVFLCKNLRINTLGIGLFLALELLLNYYVVLNVNRGEFGFFRFEPLGVLLTTISTIIAVLTVYHSYIYLNRRKDPVAHQSIYWAALIMLLACMNMTYFAENLGVLWAFLEGTTICMSLLIYHERQRTTLEATWKYVFVSSLAVALAFIGILFLTAGLNNHGETNLDFSNLIMEAHNMNPLFLKVSFVLLFIGFSGKLGVFPFHTINIDALAVAPSPITALIGSALKGVGFMGIIRIHSIISVSSAAEWANQVLMIAGILSVGIAAVELSKIKYFPRLLGYSSVEHLGIILIVISLGESAYFVALLHFVLHSFAKSGFYLQMGQIHDIFGSNKISKAGNYINVYPMGALTAVLGWFIVCALPPSGLFITEILAFKHIFAHKPIWLGILLLAFLTLIVFYSGKYIFGLLFQPPTEKETQVLTQNIWAKESISQWVLFGLVILLGFFPPAFFYHWLNAAVEFM